MVEASAVGASASDGGADPSPAESGGWQAVLRQAIRDPDELWRLLDLPAGALPAARRAAKSFPLLVPRGFLALMDRGRLDDPLLRQVVPLAAEDETVPGFTADPLDESHCSPAPGLLAKYRGRSLLVTTGACAVHCRYCFRRHYPYEEVARRPGWWRPAIDALAADPEARELLLSGGDPLTLGDAAIRSIAVAAAAVPQLVRLRVHSRLPVVLPERITDGLLEALTGTRLRLVLVIHANHPRELSPAVVAACARLREAGATVLNQSVLLAGVNDDDGVLAALSEALFAAGVLPYYLHLLDRVAGTAHFEVDEARAVAIHARLQARLPGYLVPRLVREEPGAPGKTMVG